ncbi:YceI family protein [Maribacter sp. 2304DJ31-5]
MKRTFHVLLFCLNIIYSFEGIAQKTVWKIDDLHSKIGFSVTHMMVSETEGTFDSYEAELKSDANDFSDLKVDFTIKTASINTRNERRDNHLKAEDFFDAKKYPEITFTSSSIEKGEGSLLYITGDLTIRDVTKQVTFEGDHKGTIKKDGFGLTRAGLFIKITINRQDFGIAYNDKTEAGELFLSNDVDVLCKLSIVKN